MTILIPLTISESVIGWADINYINLLYIWSVYGQVSMEEDVVLGLRLPETAFPTEYVIF